MSNTRAIEAVTSTLRNLLAAGVTDLPNQNVTTRPLDKVRGSNAIADQLNLFLFQTAHNAAWRNMDAPRRSGAGVAPPPLALNLHYLVTALGRDDDETRSHRWLGAAMMVLHDHPLLGATEILNAAVGSELEAQVERVRITPQPMSLDEMSKLWTTFQTQYRTSVAYQVDVVLIDSRRPARTPVPVLRRGRGAEEGVSAVAGATPPAIETIQLPHRQSSALLGDGLVVEGVNLGGATAVRLTPMNPRLTDLKPFDLVPAASSTASALHVTLPADPAAHAAWVAGFYSVAAIVLRDGQEFSSNALPLSIAPRIEAVTPSSPMARDGDGNVSIALTFSPEVRIESDAAEARYAQQVYLLFGAAKQVRPDKLPAPPPQPPPPRSTDHAVFTFRVADTETGEQLIRLRVDGVDMPLVDRSVTPPEFDELQKVTIT